MEYTRAKSIADRLVAQLAPYCERIQIAGSIRRKKPEPHDVELVAIPKFETSGDLFGNPTIQHSLLDPVLFDVGRHEKSGPRYKQLWLPDGIALDLFLVLPPAQWGVILAIRTGPSDYSRWLVTHRPQGGALPSYLKCADGALWNGRDLVPTPEETDFFWKLDLEWCEPELRFPPTRVAPQAELLENAKG